MMFYLVIKLLLLWTMYENSYQCSEGCGDCRNGKVRCGCKDGYYFDSQRCIKCSDGCSICKQSSTDCRACTQGHWGDWCQYSCIPCEDCIDSYCASYCKDADPSQCLNSSCPGKCTKSFTGRRKKHTDENSYQCSEGCGDCRRSNRCYGCKNGYVLMAQSFNCAKCFESCLTCVSSHTDCNKCKPGRWGPWCQYSCIPCEDCFDLQCQRYCEEVAPSKCENLCPGKCNVNFTGRRKNQTVTPTSKKYELATSQPTQKPSTKTTLTQTTTITTKSTTTNTITKHTETQPATARPKTTTFVSHVTTKKQSTGTGQSEQPGDETRANRGGTTVQAESQTDDSGTPVLYIVIAVVGVVVLVGVIVVVVCYKKKKRRPDQESSPPETNNEEIIYAKPNKVRKPDSQTGQSTELDLQGPNKDPPSISASVQGPVQSNRASNNVPSLVTDTTLDIEIIMETCLDESETVVTEASTKDDDTYYNVLSFQRNKIKVDKFEEYVKSKKAFDFYEEFQKFPKGLSRPCTHANIPENKVKCRYNGVFPYDTNRVKLVGKDNDFINASYIDGYTRQKEYIACLGPTKVTMTNFVDFWMMVWQENVEKIVMLTKLEEQGKMKCEQYWPDFGNTNKYGDVIVTCQSDDVYKDYRLRKLSVKQGETTRFVYQTHFLSWPDKRIPERTDVLLTLRDQVRAVKSEMAGPLVVHCSAGVGRTGTYIAIDILLQELTEDKAVDVFGCVIGIRGQRVAMVQTLEQYEYIHNVLLESIQKTK